MTLPRQLDLLADWTPSDPVERFDPVAVRAASVAGRISKAVSASLKGKNREAVANVMSEYLRETVSKAMLDSYASEAREDHPIPLTRLMALLHATRDRRLLQVFADEFGWAVIEERHVHLITLAEVTERQAELGRQADALRRRARR
jgi:hypothetical protein